MITIIIVQWGAYHYHANINCSSAGAATGANDPDTCKLIGDHHDDDDDEDDDDDCQDDNFDYDDYLQGDFFHWYPP